MNTGLSFPICLTKILTGEKESEEGEKSYRFRRIHETILRYLCHAWTDFIEFLFESLYAVYIRKMALNLGNIAGVMRY